MAVFAAKVEWAGGDPASEVFDAVGAFLREGVTKEGKERIRRIGGKIVGALCAY